MARLLIKLLLLALGLMFFGAGSLESSQGMVFVQTNQFGHEIIARGIAGMVFGGLLIVISAAINTQPNNNK